jgi:hypothetical protein
MAATLHRNSSVHGDSSAKNSGTNSHGSKFAESVFLGAFPNISSAYCNSFILPYIYMYYERKYRTAERLFIEFETGEFTKNMLNQVRFYLDRATWTVTSHDLCTLLSASPGKLAKYLFWVKNTPNVNCGEERHDPLYSLHLRDKSYTSWDN